MKSNKYNTILQFPSGFLFIIVLISIFISPLSAKDYWLHDVQINSEIQSDGSLLIEESRTYRFDGNFRWADYSLPLKNLGAVTDFSLKDDYSRYVEGYDEIPGTYQLQINDETFDVKWFYSADSETRTFILSYRVEDVVTVHQDVAEFYYKFVGENKQKSISNVRVQLSLPQPADTSQVRAWAHGSLHGDYRFENGNIIFKVAPLPQQSFWEARVIFPLQWVPDAKKVSPLSVKETIMEEEAELVRQSNLRREKAKKQAEFKKKHKETVFNVSIIIALIGLGIFYVLYNTYGHREPLPHHMKISSEIPDNLNPALANYIYSVKNVGAGAMVSTLLDLGRKGFIKIEETEKEKKFLLKTKKKKIFLAKLDQPKYEKEKHTLSEHERDLVEFIFTELASGQPEIELNEIKSQSTKVTKWFNNWKKLINAQWGDRPFYNKDSVKGLIISLVISVVIIAMGIFALIKFGSSGFITLAAGFVLLILSFFILRYTKEVRQIRKKLIAFRRYILKYEYKKDTANLQTHLEKFFIYGIALGVSSQAIKKMFLALPDQYNTNFFPWYIMATSRSSPAAFADSISGMVSAASMTMGTAAGVGGGASAGGGGGAGGAGGGAG